MSISRRTKVAIVGAFAAGVTALTPAAASAGIYTWDYYATYSTQAECEQNGQALTSSGEADVYRCSGASGTDLYLGYTW